MFTLSFDTVDQLSLWVIVSMESLVLYTDSDTCIIICAKLMSAIIMHVIINMCVHYIRVLYDLVTSRDISELHSSDSFACKAYFTD